MVNRTRVLEARLHARRLPGGGACEILLLEPEPEPQPLLGSGGEATRAPGPAGGTPGGRPIWRALVRPAKRLRGGQRVRLVAPPRPAATQGTRDGPWLLEQRSGLDVEAQGEGPELEVQALGEGFARVVLPPGIEPLELLRRFGETPLPPYIRRPAGAEPEDRARYQTVYAREPGSVAAPTAGLHFTEDLLARLAARGIEHAEVVLHVGPATFLAGRPGRSSLAVEAERYQVPPGTRAAVARARARGRRVLAVGTTTTRALESAALAGWPDGEARTDLVIGPGFPFQAVTTLLTNFHLPGTSLLSLVAGFLGVDLAREVYETAVRERYRFYSYGDALLVL